MGNLTFQQALAYAEDLPALAVMASGQNPDGTAFMGSVSNTPTGLLVVGDNPAVGPAQPTLALGYDLVSGGQWSRERVPDTFPVLNAQGCATETTIYTPPPGRRFRLMGCAVTSNNAGNIVLRDNTAGTIIAVVPTSAGGGPLPLALGNGILSAAVGNVLTVTGPGAGATVSGMLLLMTE